jgi:hypothetical protein
VCQGCYTVGLELVSERREDGVGDYDDGWCKGVFV